MSTFVSVTRFCEMLVNREAEVALRDVTTNDFIDCRYARELEYSEYALYEVCYIDIDTEGNFYGLYVKVPEEVLH